ncbi:MAG TPA: L,D-transpeptidase [Ignavibacteriaceae bacterium]|nr:L,D-transpeptidase [Ignavibacteriaceae bacterium]
MDNNKKLLNIDFSHLKSYININMFKNVLYFSGGIIIFILGVIVYGIILNLREIPLKDEMEKKGISKFRNPSIVIDRKSYTLNIYEDTIFVKSYRVNFGRSISSPKAHFDDGATPVGNYNVCRIDSNHVYYKFIRINYPNIEDGAEALRKNLITQKDFDKLRFEYYYNECPAYNAILGGDIGIHGMGNFNFMMKNLPFVFNWTDGSVALSNENIDEIISIITRGTKVVIK